MLPLISEMRDHDHLDLEYKLADGHLLVQLESQIVQASF